MNCHVQRYCTVQYMYYTVPVHFAVYRQSVRSDRCFSLLSSDSCDIGCTRGAADYNGTALTAADAWWRLNLKHHETAARAAPAGFAHGISPRPIAALRRCGLPYGHRPIPTVPDGRRSGVNRPVCFLHVFETMPYSNCGLHPSCWLPVPYDEIIHSGA